MFGGFLKTTSALAILASASVVLGGLSAQAADLGGNCCADLEERVAELEATTVRKGNRKVSLQLYGQVSQAVMFWNDGGESNVYMLENNTQKNRLGVRGSAKINGDWSAGYNIELQVRSGRSSSADQNPLATTQGASVTAFNTQSVSLRYAYWNLKSNTYGTLAVGRQTDVTIGTSSVNLVNPDGFAGTTGAGYAGQGFRLRRAGTKGRTGLATGTTTPTTLSWFQVTGNGNGASIVSFDGGPAWNGVKYTSPFFLGQSKKSGFLVSAGWGFDDELSVALRYVEDFGTFRVAAAVGYAVFSGSERGGCADLTGTATSASESSTDCDSLQASGSIMHVPTGLYVSGGYAEWNDNNRKQLAGLAPTAGLTAASIDDKDTMWYVQAGWQAKLTSLGSTIFWGQYMVKENGLSMNSGQGRVVSAADQALFGAGGVHIAGSTTDIWGGGITQKIDAAAMALYAGYYNYSMDMTMMTAAGVKFKSNPIDDFSVFFAGATIKF